MRILIVLTSQETIGQTNKPTGFHFSEFSHPYEFFVSHGYEVVVGSPKGGECPITSPHPEDKINDRFYKDSQKMRIIRETVGLENLLGEQFDAVFVAGGHGTMFDLPNNPILAEILIKTLERGGLVAAVCHGPAALVGVKDRNGKFIVSGRRVNSFTNAEEKATPYFENVPFLLESKLVEQGALFESSPPRQAHLAVDDNLVTGQNPESVDLVSGAVHTLLCARSG